MPEPTQAQPAPTLFDQLKSRLDELKQQGADQAGASAALRTELSALTARITALESMAQDVKDRSASVPAVTDMKKKGEYSLARAMMSLHPDFRGKEREIAPAEWEVSDEVMKRGNSAIAERTRHLAQTDRARIATTQVPSTGAILIPPEGLGGFYDYLWANLVYEQLGVTKLTGLQGSPVPFLTKTGTVTVQSITEGQPPTVTTDLTFKMRDAIPHEVIGYVGHSLRLLALANQDVDGMCERDLAMQIQLKMEELGLLGKGGEGEPDGILRGAGGASGAHLHLQGTLKYVTDYDLADGANVPTVAKSLDWEGILEDAKVPIAGAKYLCHPKVLRKLRKDTANANVLSSPLSREKIAELTGYSWVTSTALPTNMVKSGMTATGSLAHLAYGQWRDVVMPMWGGLEIRRSTEATHPTTGQSAFFSRLAWIQATALFDIIVGRAESIVASNEVQYT